MRGYYFVEKLEEDFGVFDHGGHCLFQGEQSECRSYLSVLLNDLYRWDSLVAGDSLLDYVA